MKSEMFLNRVSSNGPESEPARWMLVDDCEGILNSMALLLERAGCGQVYRFRSAAKAIEAFEAAPAAWDVVVTDLEMPGMDGIELCRRMRAAAPDLKVFLTTADYIITEKEALQRGFSGLLHKPFPISALLRMLLVAGVINHVRDPGETGVRPACVAA